MLVVTKRQEARQTLFEQLCVLLLIFGNMEIIQPRFAYARSYGR